MSHSKTTIQINERLAVEAIEPVIVSASRATDIPALFGDWFIKTLQDGYCVWQNPFSGKQQYVSFFKTRAIVFWTKNPEPFLNKLETLNTICPNYYFLYSLNDYELEKYEEYIPSLKHRIETFVNLSSLIGRNRVLWRFDPFLLSKDVDLATLHNRIKALGDVLCPHSNILIFSFIDIVKYKKIQHRLRRMDSSIREFSEEEKIETATFLRECLKTWQTKNPEFRLALCGQDIDLQKYNIYKSSCVDAHLLLQLFPNDKALVEYIKSQKTFKDKGQRSACGCFISKDIGAYNTCTNGCVYCYANR